MGLRAQAAFFTAGGAACTGARNAQCSFQGAPCSIQSLDLRDLRRREALVRRLGRHAARGIGRADALIEQASAGLPRRSRRSRAGLLLVQTQTRHARAGVGSVALEAVIGEERTDLALEIDRLSRERRSKCKPKKVPHGVVGDTNILQNRSVLLNR